MVRYADFKKGFVEIDWEFGVLRIQAEDLVVTSRSMRDGRTKFGWSRNGTSWEFWTPWEVIRAQGVKKLYSSRGAREEFGWEGPSI